MSDLKEYKGGCLCGDVTFSSTIGDFHSGACHCSACRKWAGGPLMTVDCGTNITFQGEENISVFSSSAWAERGFCKKCGSNLFYRLKKSQGYHVMAGLFEDQNMPFTIQVFIDEKPDFYSFANETKTLTGPELFAMFSGASDNES